MIVSFKQFICKFFHILLLGLIICRCFIAQQLLSYILNTAFFLARLLSSIIFVHKAVVPLVSNVNSAAIPTGYGNTLGNKGGVGITFDIGFSSFCFITAHLSAHQHAVSRRTWEFHRISYGISKVLGRHPSAEIKCSTSNEEDYKNYISHFALANQFDFVFWSGDLNYRIHASLEEVEDLLKGDRLDTLQKLDQLEHVKLCTPFRGFLEGPLNFPPTYKLYPNSGRFHVKVEAYRWVYDCTIVALSLTQLTSTFSFSFY